LKRFITILIFISLVASKNCHAQAHDTIIFSKLGNFNFTWTYSGYTPLFDRLNRPFIYLASKELGLVTFDISNTLNPFPIDTISVSALGNLKATGVTQDSIYLYISLGDFQSTQNAGLAIYDITNPVAPVLLDNWTNNEFNKGSASVIFKGNYVYLSAMEKGVLILDVADKKNIKFVSQIIPDTDFGNKKFTYHSRGLFIKGDSLLVADDNGGLRIIDVTNKKNPIEIGKYINNKIDSIGAVYCNHVYQIENFAYCAMDFCGVELLDVTYPSSIISVAWLNPWNCNNLPFPFGSWNGSEGHINEIAYSALHNILFFSGGDTEIIALSTDLPDKPRILGSWGKPGDNVGSWGIDILGNLAAIANVHTLGFPFVSINGGLQLLSWQHISGIEKFDLINKFQIFPNPASTKVILQSQNYFQKSTILINDLFGNTVKCIKNNTGTNIVIPCDDLPEGFYFISIIEKDKIIGTCKMTIQK
jgi:hypothetical protein